ncbi:MAG: ribonuclease P protein component, partial [Actinomycetota bacterium]
MSTQQARWQVEQVLALAPKPSSLTAAQPLAVASRWVASGCDGRGVWGRCTGTSAEPYDCVIDHVGVAFRCTCPSRSTPCKHALALLLLWVRGSVAEADTPPGFASSWLAGRVAEVVEPTAVSPVVDSPSPPRADTPADASGPAAGPTPAPEQQPFPPTRDGRDDRVARMSAGLAELDRWLDDRLRTGLADPSLAVLRTGFITTKRCGKAHERNLLRRRFRTLVQTHAPGFTEIRRFLVTIARPGAGRVGELHEVVV